MLQILPNHSLQTFHTFAVNCKAQQIVIARSNEDVDELFAGKYFKTQYYIIGGGSNLLFANDFHGTIIHLKTEGFSIIKEDASSVWIEVAAGEVFDTFIQHCVYNQWYGLENLAYIPGHVGSSAVQNIGAYGVEVKDCIETVKGRVIPSGKSKSYALDECKFGYRDSIFKGMLAQKFLITSVVFRLSKKEQYNLSYKALQDYFTAYQQTPTLKGVYEAIVAIRKSKLPETEQLPSAGSFFKNPIVTYKYWEKLCETYPNLIQYSINEKHCKLAAGQLIELCGWKGYSNNKVAVYDKQALVIVNKGNATGEEILALSHEIKISVFQKMGIILEEEVVIL